MLNDTYLILYKCYSDNKHLINDVAKRQNIVEAKKTQKQKHKEIKSSEHFNPLIKCFHSFMFASFPFCNLFCISVYLGYSTCIESVFFRLIANCYEMITFTWKHTRHK